MYPNSKLAGHMTLTANVAPGDIEVVKNDTTGNCTATIKNAREQKLVFKVMGEESYQIIDSYGFFDFEPLYSDLAVKTGVPLKKLSDQKLKELFKENGNPPIDFNVDKITVFEVVVKPNSEVKKVKAGHKGRKKLIPSQTEFNKLLQYCSVPRTMPEILSFMGYIDRTKFRNKYLKPLLDDGKLAMTDPEHPRSSKQKYKTV